MLKTHGGSTGQPHSAHDVTLSTHSSLGPPAGAAGSTGSTGSAGVVSCPACCR